MSHHTITATLTVPVPDDMQKMAEAIAKVSQLWTPLKAAVETLSGSTTFDFTPAVAPRPVRRRGRPPRIAAVPQDAA